MAMRTKLQGGIVVGFDGRSHTLIRGGVVVWEDDRIPYVGKDDAQPELAGPHGRRSLFQCISGG
jgi:cytosine/adenosine deaminase-related metal-dependent hydrolase